MAAGPAARRSRTSVVRSALWWGLVHRAVPTGLLGQDRLRHLLGGRPAGEDEAAPHAADVPEPA